MADAVPIIGFGSLLSVASARRTFPNLSGFRLCKVKGYRRVFAHAAAVFFDRGIAKPETGEISSLSVEPWEGGEFIASLFYIPEEELPGFYEREMEFLISKTTPYDIETGEPIPVKGLICEKSSDAHFLKIKGQATFDATYGKHGVTQIWDRTDVLPCRAYLRHCVLAAESLGPPTHASFLDHTYLCDRTTTIRQHLANDPTIMDELPTEAARPFYSG